MGCLQNHCCVPNTRHHFDANQKMYVSAAIPIREGEELTMIYSDVLWDTMLRRQYLAKTKHFHCTCSRCSDRTEYGTLLGALKCAGLQCDGILLPNDPLDFNTSWTCNQCRLIISGRQIKSIQTGLGSIVQEMTYENPKKVFKFLQKELPVLVPSSNYIAMDLKFRIVSYFGRVEGFSWKELSKMELKFKLNYCKDLLTLLDTLGCGDCKKKGLIMYELYCTIMEERARDKANLDIQNESTEIQSDLESSTLLLQKAVQILQNDITVPDDYNKEVESLQTKLSIL
ncbi:protein msta [Orussus abietinus]|uniref:protein msta n=1 Tax=Orussus abietinus TaxID=222816 RepID=UPI000C716129|nr:protein msta [Orussus abietinus]